MNNTRSFSFIKAWATLLCVVLFTSTAMAASSADGLWNDVSADRVASKGTRATIPDRYRTSTVDIKRLVAALEKSPAEGSDSAGVHLTLPMPDGSYQDFLVKSSPIMAPELAAQYKDISTYSAVSVKDPAVNGRLDITPAGFHAIIFNQQGTVYIDPFQTGSNHEYIIYDKRAFNKNREAYYCSVTGKKVDASHNPLDHVRAPVGGTLRTYRTAVAATGEYTAFHGGTVLAGQAAIITTMNRVSGIYERELSVRLLLVANSSLLVYTNPATDPYSNTNGGALLVENQANIDAVIGSSNYDLGHVFGTAGGGLASLGVVCNNGFKARGETGSESPIGDAFDVDFVAHKIGHQFGGNHTIDDVEIIRGVSPAVPSTCARDVPANDDFANAFVIGEGVFQDTLVGATVDGSNSINSYVDVWYAYTASADGLLTINTCETQEAFGMDTFISAHTNTGVVGSGANEIYVNDDYLFSIGAYPATALRECDRPFITGLDSAMAFPVSSGEPILIRVSEFDPPETEFLLEVRLDPFASDIDGDGFTDDVDNCTLISNADQRDTNGDGYGNVCDPDLNNDGVVNFADFGAWVPFFNTACGDVDEDFDGSGSCNFGDFSLFPQFFLEPPGPSGVAL